jgi:hypothetical protein
MKTIFQALIDQGKAFAETLKIVEQDLFFSKKLCFH